MPSMRLTTSPVMPCSGESNGSAALVTNTSVPSDPQISICLAQLPAGQTDPLSARSRSSQTKRMVRIGVGLLPYISIASVWQQRRPVITDLAASRHRLTIDTSSCRMVALGDVASVISRSSYLFGVSWPDVRRTLLVAVEQDGDPYRNTFGSSFTRFSPNDCVQAGIIKNHVSSAAPSNSATWKEFERSGHAMAV